MSNQLLAQRIHEIADADLNWDAETGEAYLRCGVYKIKMHMRPCHTFDPIEVFQIAEHLEDVFPLSCKVKYYLSNHIEISGRLAGTYQIKNASVAQQGDYAVFLSGSVEAIHPAMKRAVIAREYSRCVVHHMANLIDRNRKKFVMGALEDLLRKYAGDRGVQYDASTEELACHDIRLCVFGIEPEFWPHKAVTPEKDGNIKIKVRDYWLGLRNKYTVEL